MAINVRGNRPPNRIKPTGTFCSPAGSSTFDGPVRGFIDTSYAENTGKRVSFSWKRTF